MSLILCPECGTRISDKATTCPHCGYISENSSLPISLQDKYEIIPRFEYDIVEWNPNGTSLSIYCDEDNKNLIQYFGKWERIKTTMPAIAEVIQSMAQSETVLVADMDAFVKKLIKSGEYRFTIDKHGEILPTIRDSGGIVKQVRLKEISFIPDAIESLNHLQTQAMLNRILEEIEYVGDAIREIHVELQNDRIAMAEGTRDKLLQARQIQNTRLREIAILNAVNTATDAKRVLMRNFSQNVRYISEHSGKGSLQLILQQKSERDVGTKAADALQALVSITNAVQIECEGYAMLGELDAAQICLNQFRDFVVSNHLENRDTLLLLNSNSTKKQTRIVNEFSQIAKRISTFNTSTKLQMSFTGMLTDGGQTYENNEEKT